MTWGSWGKQFSTAEMIALMNHCFDLGISSFDHADIYGGYTTESDFGKAFKDSSLKRENIQLISKCGIQMNAAQRTNVVKHYDYSKDYIITSVEQSLKNLKTDYLDMLLLHRPSPLMNPQIVAEAISKLQTEGKIRDFGVSNFSASQIAMLEKEIPVVANQVEFSLTANEVMYNGTLNDCIANKRMAMAWSPLGSIFKTPTERSTRIQIALNKMTEKYGVSNDVLALTWIMNHPAKIFPVLGTTTPSRLSDAMKATEIQLEKTDWFILLEASNGHEVP